MQRPITSITVTVPPELEPVTVEEAKNYAKIDTADDDELIETFIQAAREAAEKYMRRAIITQTFKYTVDQLRSNANDYLGEGVYDLPVSILSGGLPNSIDLPYKDVQSIASVVTYNDAGTSSAFSSDNYYLDSSGGRLVLKSTASWPSAMRDRNACEITYVAGYGDGSDAVPAAIRIGIMRHTQAMYDTRMVCDMPAECMNHYHPYRVYG